MPKIRINELERLQLSLDDVVTVYTVIVTKDGEWITNYLEGISPFSYITILFDETHKSSVGFYHDPKGWIVTEIHDKIIFNAALRKIISLGTYHGYDKIEDVVNYLIKADKLREFM